MLRLDQVTREKKNKDSYMTSAQPLLSSSRTDQRTPAYTSKLTSMYSTQRLSTWRDGSQGVQDGTDSITAHGSRADNPPPGWGCLVGAQFERLGFPICGKPAGRFGLPSAAWPAIFANSFPAFQLHAIPQGPCPRSHISCVAPFLQKHPGATTLGACCLLQIPHAYYLFLETC
jgi:hypothetical protein